MDVLRTWHCGKKHRHYLSLHVSSYELHPFLRRVLVDPDTRATFNTEAHTLISSSAEYPIEAGIPCLISRRSDLAHHQEHYRIDAELFDYYEERDPATEHDEVRLRETILRQLPKSSESILDVGCGKAWVAAALCPSGKTVCSLDVSISNPLKALTHYPFASHCAVVADAMALPFRDASFDAIIASEIIEHLPNPTGFVNELLRVLKPDGVLLVSTPYKEKLRYVLCIHCNQRTPVHAHIQSFDEYTLRSLAPDFVGDFSFTLFGNKALLLLRSYVFMRWMPYRLWLFCDRLASRVIRKDAHIMVRWKKDRVERS